MAGWVKADRWVWSVNGNAEGLEEGLRERKLSIYLSMDGRINVAQKTKSGDTSGTSGASAGEKVEKRAGSAGIDETGSETNVRS